MFDKRMFDKTINPQALCNWRHFLAFGMGAGLARHAPGTWGTLAAVPFCVTCWLLLPAWLFALLLVCGCVFGVWLCQSVSRDMGVHDHGGIVWDEWIGYGIALWALPTAWYWPLAAFVLFRALDIAKPWPISVADRKLDGGFGIMLDDVLAGALCCALLHAVNYVVVSIA